MNVTITGWARYQPRLDQKNHTWLRFQNDFFSRDTFCTLSPEERIAWIYLLCVASQKGKGRVFIIHEHFTKLTLQPFSTFKSMVEKLKKLPEPPIETDASHESVKSSHESVQSLHAEEIVMQETEKDKENQNLPESVQSLHESVLKLHATDVRTDDTNDTNDTNVTDVTNVTNDTKRLSSSEIKISRPPAFDFCLLELWNAYCGALPKIRELSEKRKKKVSVLLKKKNNKTYWIEVIQRMQLSDFCNGQSDSGWIATFDFLLRPDTHIKVLEGNYDNREKKQKRIQTRVEIATAHNRDLLERVMKGDL